MVWFEFVPKDSHVGSLGLMVVMLRDGGTPQSLPERVNMVLTLVRVRMCCYDKSKLSLPFCSSSSLSLAHINTTIP